MSLQKMNEQKHHPPQRIFALWIAIEAYQTLLFKSDVANQGDIHHFSLQKKID